MKFDEWGELIVRPEISHMLMPVQHVACGDIHDAGECSIVYRYADATGWTCPGCGGTCDDRPLGWGGNVRRLDRN